MPRAELDVQQHENDGDTDGDDESETPLFLFQAVELAGPGVLVAGRHPDLIGHATLQIQNGAGQVAPPHAELNRNVAAPALVINHEGAIADGHVCYHRELYLVAVGGWQQDAGDLIGRAAEIRRIANGKIESAVVVDDLGNGRTADSGLDHVVDVLGLQTIARGLVAVDGDEKTRLASDIEDAYVGDAWNLLHDAGNLSGNTSEFLEIIAEELE